MFLMVKERVCVLIFFSNVRDNNQVVQAYMQRTDQIKVGVDEHKHESRT